MWLAAAPGEDPISPEEDTKLLDRSLDKRCTGTRQHMRLSSSACIVPVQRRLQSAPVAQLDRAADFESETYQPQTFSFKLLRITDFEHKDLRRT